MGLSGLGDLVLTATGDLSRNRTVGLELAARQGARRRSSPISATSPKACAARRWCCARAPRSASRCRSSTPSADVLAGTIGPEEALEQLMRREARPRGRSPRGQTDRRSRSGARPRTPRPRPRCSGSGCAGRRASAGARAARRRTRRAPPAGRPAVSLPNTSQSPAWNATSASGAAAAVVNANSAARSGARRRDEGGPRGVPPHVGVLVVVEPGAPQQRVVHREAERLDQVQACSRCWPRAGSRCRCSAGSRAATRTMWNMAPRLPRRRPAAACAPAPRPRPSPRRPA